MALIIPIFGRLSRIHVMSFLTGWLFKPEIFSVITKLENVL